MPCSRKPGLESNIASKVMINDNLLLYEQNDDRYVGLLFSDLLFESSTRSIAWSSPNSVISAVFARDKHHNTNSHCSDQLIHLLEVIGFCILPSALLSPISIISVSRSVPERPWSSAVRHINYMAGLEDDPRKTPQNKLSTSSHLIQ
jgi:hypothetical protein